MNLFYTDLKYKKMLEEFQDIINHENYMIHRDGRIWSKLKGGRILKPYLNGNGYYQVDLGRSHRSKTVHRLVAIQFIPNPENKPQVDHKDGNINNNDVLNLRWATCHENGANSGISKNNKSGTNGIHWRKDSNKWRSCIRVNRRLISLGCFENIEDAILARQEAEEEYFKEFRRNPNQS